MSATDNDAAAKVQASRVAITEDLTIYNAIAQKQALLDQVQEHALIELDLSQVSQIDTSGIQLLMLAKRECQKRDKTLNIVAHSPAVHELMDFYNIAGFFGDPLVIPARDA